MQAVTRSKNPVPGATAAANKKGNAELVTKGLASQPGPSPAIDVTKADQDQIDAENQNLVKNMTSAEVLHF